MPEDKDERGSIRTAAMQKFYILFKTGLYKKWTLTSPQKLKRGAQFNFREIPAWDHEKNAREARGAWESQKNSREEREREITQIFLGEIENRGNPVHRAPRTFFSRTTCHIFLFLFLSTSSRVILVFMLLN